MPSPLQTIAKILREEDHFLVASHFNPDGDAIGSLAAVGHILASLGKTFTLYNPSGLPAKFQWLDIPGEVHEILPDDMPAWTIILDSGSPERTGLEMVSRMDETRVISIDHHLGNPEFGEVNWVDVREPAVGSMIALLADELEIPLTGSLAESVYLAVSTDTGFFTYGSTTPECLELVARLLRDGLDMSAVNTRITKTWSIERLRLWSEVIDTVELHMDGQVGVAAVTAEMLERTGTKAGDTENIINFVRRLESVRVAAILREEGPDTYKFSLRSYGADNVQEVAAQFGGGGHKNAAGGAIQAPLDEAKELLVRCIGETVGLK
ncbi:DHH family phosphoesterase [Salidesulfovibrio onnuriiensis]|uniref:DHH family phosphoesterase n=1 Tax=Salidesulfovibrio onnuriiensis TaxID=2583823 RepID=UPI0011CA4E45|nr:bifunctional oligoribonuclease/PAP phosphatase NrnA [Salidesulfovibrio onnuriiensis]